MLFAGLLAKAFVQFGDLPEAFAQFVDTPTAKAFVQLGNLPKAFAQCTCALKRWTLLGIVG